MPMRRVLLSALAIGIATTLFGRTSSNAADEVAIHGAVQKYMDARDQRDATALAALFTSDVDQLVSSGEWRKGREAVVKGTLGSSQSTGGTRTITVESVRFLAPDVALADGRYELTGLANGESRKMWTTILLKHDPDGWHIAAIRNMLPAPPAGRVTVMRVPNK